MRITMHIIRKETIAEMEIEVELLSLNGWQISGSMFMTTELKPGPVTHTYFTQPMIKEIKDPIPLSLLRKR